MVVLGVLTGPSVVSCFNNPDGLGQCLRGKMVEAGLVPAPPATEVAEVDAPAEPAADTAVEGEVTETAALDVTEPAEPAMTASEVVAATFGLLRAEPDGSVVIAGSGTPGSEVEVYLNGSLLGRATVETSGDWVLVPDAPLPTGGVEITLGEKGKPGQSPDSFIVVIHDDKSTQPLVVASAPGQASDVIQGLIRTNEQVADAPAVAATDAPADPQPTATEETDVAATPTSATPADDSVTEVAEQETPASDTPPVDQSASTIEVAEVTETAPAATEQPATISAPEATEAPAESEPTEPELPVVDETAAETSVEEPEATAPTAQVEETPASQPASDTPAEAEASEETETQIAAVTPQADPVLADPLPTLADTPTTIDAIELEGARTFFAGAGPNGGVIRLYVDEAHIADAVIDNGRWLIEAGSVLNKPTQRIRADLLRSGSADVLARAEVDFVVQLPGNEPSTAVADTAAEEPTVSETPEATVASSEPQAVDEPVDTEVAASSDVPASSEPASVPSEESVTEPEVAEVPSAIAPETDAPSAPATDAAQATTPQVSEPAPVISSEPQPAVPTLVAVSVGDPEAQRFAAGKAIIRRGDNLWTIARRVYGEGIKYTTIYQANTGQIRDPDRIYPGQVFDLPTGQQ